MTLVKTYLGTEIHVNEKGRFSAQLPGGVKKESVQLKVVEQFILDFTPKGKVDLITLPSGRRTAANLTHVTVKGIYQPSRLKNSYWGDQPRYVTGKKSYRDEPETIPTGNLGWPDAALEADYAMLMDQWADAERKFEERAKALVARFKPAKIDDVVYALEHGGQPA